MRLRSRVHRLILTGTLCFSALLFSAMPPALQTSAATAPSSLPVKANIPLQGPQRFVTLFCQFPDLLPNEPLRAYYEALLGTTGPGMADYWREVSYGQISLAGSRIAGWYAMPHSSNDYHLGHFDQAVLERLAEDCTAAAEEDIHFPDYIGINLVFNFCIDGAYGGAVRLARDGVAKRYGVTWLCMGKFAWQSVVAHEMGHAFRLTHSSGGPEGYGNPWDLMSSCDNCRFQPHFGSIAQHPIAYWKDQLGWIPADRKYVALPDSVAQLALERLARPEKDGYLMAQIPLPDGGFYTLEARRRVGYDRNAPADGVVIHRIGPGARPAVVLVKYEPRGSELVDSVWVPGMVFVDDAHGIRVTVDRSNGTGYVVTISNGAAG